MDYSIPFQEEFLKLILDMGYLDSSLFIELNYAILLYDKFWCAQQAEYKSILDILKSIVVLPLYTNTEERGLQIQILQPTLIKFNEIGKTSIRK